MDYLFLSLMILGGLVALCHLVKSVAADMRRMERDDELDHIGGRRKKTGAEIVAALEKWREGK